MVDTDRPATTLPYLDVERDRHVQLWRYLDPLKFLSMLHRKSLFFTRADYLGDDHEGALGEKNLEAFIDRLRAAKSEDRGAIVAEFKKGRDQRRKIFGVSCWHANSVESAAMWRLYAPQGAGIAVQTTVGHLNEVVHAVRPEIWFGLVHYVDYKTRELNDSIDPDYAVFSLLHKRQAFSYESEVRLMTLLTEQEQMMTDLAAIVRRSGRELAELPDLSIEHLGLREQLQRTVDEGGVNVRVDLGRLIQRVVIAPGFPKYGEDALNAALNSAGLGIRAERTGLDEPAYDHISWVPHKAT